MSETLDSNETDSEDESTILSIPCHNQNLQALICRKTQSEITPQIENQHKISILNVSILEEKLVEKDLENPIQGKIIDNFNEDSNGGNK